MKILFVHGMGRTSLSGWPMLNELKRSGLTVSTFDYSVSIEPFYKIQERLTEKVVGIANTGKYRTARIGQERGAAQAAVPMALVL